MYTNGTGGTKMKVLKTVILLLACGAMSACSVQNEHSSKDTKSPQKEQEVQKNLGSKADMSGYDKLKTKDHHFITSSMNELLQAEKNKKSGVYYMGYVDCPWCQDAVPVLEDAAKEEGIYIHYVAIRDKAHNVTFDEKTKEQFFAWASNSLPKDDQGKPTLYVPFVIAMKDGKIVQTHDGTVNGHDANKRDLTENEKTKLKEIYIKLIKQS